MVAVLKMPKRFPATAVNDDDRRLFPRTEARTWAEGRRMDHTLPAHRTPRLVLALRDLSLGGLSAVSDVPLARGERLAVAFPDAGTLRAWDATGRVIRCDPSSVGYRIAVEFDPLPAAA